MKVFIHSFGCRVNQYEGERLREGFETSGLAFDGRWVGADICVVNTCSVTDHADRDARTLIRKIRDGNPIAKVVVTGCYATRAPEEIQKMFPDVLVVANDEKETVPSLFGCSLGLGKKSIDSFLGHTRAYIKVQDGCNMRCAYCIIPSTRSVMNSRKPQEVLEEIQGLFKRGYREFVLCGIRLGRYWSQDESGRWVDLSGLIRRITETPGDFRIRLSSIEVTDLTDRFLEAYAHTPKIVSYFHVPLQSGSDSVLHAMKRWYGTRFYAERVDAVRKFLGGDTAIFTDFMVGFPTETQDDFNESLAFAKKIGFAGMHIFRFSSRRDTPASLMKAVYPAHALRERLEKVQELDLELRANFAARFLGKEVSVLREERKTNYWRARADNFLEVNIAGDRNPARSAWETVKITQVKGSQLLAHG